MEILRPLTESYRGDVVGAAAPMPRDIPLADGVLSIGPIDVQPNGGFRVSWKPLGEQPGQTFWYANDGRYAYGPFRLVRHAPEARYEEEVPGGEALGDAVIARLAEQKPAEGR
jgi:hypothetical protein